VEEVGYAPRWNHRQPIGDDQQEANSLALDRIDAEQSPALSCPTSDDLNVRRCFLSPGLPPSDRTVPTFSTTPPEGASPAWTREHHVLADPAVKSLTETGCEDPPEAPPTRVPPTCFALSVP
jgi:hypothetical protein